jgi:hypothetical protein
MTYHITYDPQGTFIILEYRGSLLFSVRNPITNDLYGLNNIVTLNFLPRKISKTEPTFILCHVTGPDLHQFFSLESRHEVFLQSSHYDLRTLSILNYPGSYLEQNLFLESLGFKASAYQESEVLDPFFSYMHIADPQKWELFYAYS